MKDSVDRQLAIDALVELFKRIPTNAIRAKKTIENLPPAQPESKWIPCKERTPEKDGKYLITAQPTYNHAKDIKIAYWCYRWVGYNQSEILAWMPLPSAYREEGEK